MDSMCRITAIHTNSLAFQSNGVLILFFFFNLPDKRYSFANVAGRMTEAQWKSGSRLVIDAVDARRQLSDRRRISSNHSVNGTHCVVNELISWEFLALQQQNKHKKLKKR